MSNAYPSIQKLSWQDISQEVIKVNPKFAEAVNQLDPDSSYIIYKIRYRYGDTILKNSVFHLPNDTGRLIPITSNTLDEEIKRTLNYNRHHSNPVCMILNKTSELYVTVKNQVIPYIFLKPGDLMGLWDIFNAGDIHHPTFIWDMSAGARSIFMLPKISEAMGHKRLQTEMNIQTKPPTHLYQHWQVFKELVQSDQHNQNDWHMDMLCFSKKWFEHKNDARWEEFYGFLLRSSWSASSYYRNHSVWGLIFSMIRDSKNVKIDNYFCNIIKHIFDIGMGMSPGFSPALTNDSAPISYLQSIYVDGPYNLRLYTPTIMVPTIFSSLKKHTQPVYFSPKYLTALDFSPKMNKKPSLITELHTIQLTLFDYIEELLDNKLNISSTALYKMLQRTDFDFFHFYKDAEPRKNIYPNDNILSEDARFLKTMSPMGNRKFPTSAPFIRSCIRTKRKT